MWSTRAVLSMLVGDLAHLRSGEEAAAEPPTLLATIERARRRSLTVIALDWVAILVLLLASDARQDFFTLGPTVRTVFTLGVLAVAVHSGFRLGQLEKYSAVLRVCRDLLGRESSPPS